MTGDQIALAPAPVDSSGRIAFRLRIGVTGHRDLGLGRVQEITRRVRAELTSLTRLLPRDGPTPVELSVLSQLAEGADRLVANEVLKLAADQGRRAMLEAVLPMHRDSYASEQNWDDTSRAEFTALLEHAILVSEPRRASYEENRHTSHAFERAGQNIIARCDVLLAIWDGGPTGGRGGTAETLLAAAAEGKPCVWIPVDPAQAVRDNLKPGTSGEFHDRVAERAAVPDDRAVTPPADFPPDVLEPLRESFAHLQRFNGERLPAGFGQRLRDEFGFPGGAEDWVAPFFLRAATLAGKYQTRFSRSTRVICLLAIVAAGTLGVHLSLNSNSAWDWGEVASLAALTVVFVIVRRQEFHARWMSYRFLAERLRSARFLIPIGADVQWAMNSDAVYIERHSSDWALRAVEEFWQSERQRRTPEDKPVSTDVLQRRLRGDWIDRQIQYHSKREKYHRTWNRFLAAASTALFACTVVCAVLDACAISKSVTGCLSVVLPATAASLGALFTIRQHRQLAERSAKMTGELKRARHAIASAGSRKALAAAAVETARIMTDESDDWMDALWFLDVDHPG